MIELSITKTCCFATTGKNAGWQQYDHARKTFDSVADARAWLRTEYGNARRGAMYRDMPDSPPVRCGYVIGFRCKYRNKGEAIMEQHWIGFHKRTVIDLDTRAP